MKKLLFITLSFVVLMSGCVKQSEQPNFTTSVETTTTTELTTTSIEEEHHGTSTLGSCLSDNDCIVSGCNSEICQSKFEEPLVSICVYDPPYPDELGYECKCMDQKCTWKK